MSYVARIDENACAAHGDCEAIAPEIFRVDDVAVVIANGPTRRPESRSFPESGRAALTLTAHRGLCAEHLRAPTR
jgi:ferredoxin